VAVLVPAYDAAPFIERALASLLDQSFGDWEAVVVDDGSTDETASIAEQTLAPARGRVLRCGANRGVGAALNVGLEASTAQLVAYLPADDVIYPRHLEWLVAALDKAPNAALAYAGVAHHVQSSSIGPIEGYGLQLIQVMHRRTADRWLERDELVTDDLDAMLWGALRQRGRFVETGEVSCAWVDHPAQRHKLIRESLGGGVNVYRRHFAIDRPLRFRSSEGELLEEQTLYGRFRERRAPPRADDGLKIVLVGELAYNPERVLSFVERGHRLYGLWTPDGAGFNSVGPAPFGHVEEIPSNGWQQAFRRIRPDVVYGLLNWHAIPFAHHVLTGNPGLPFVWHFKESPFAAIERGLWPMLAELDRRADARVYSSQEMRDWYDTALPSVDRDDGLSIVQNGDLPKAEWFTPDPGERLSDADGDVHTVCAGRPFGIYPDLLAELATHGIHTHFHGPTWGDWWRDWIAEAHRLAPDHVHLHPSVLQPDWVRVLSRYDAAWLHVFRSENEGDLRRARWDDLNLPARLGTYAAAGLPLLQPDHGTAVVSTQTLARSLGVGIFLDEVDSFAARLTDREELEQRRGAMWAARDDFTFDAHVDRLVALFRRAIEARTSSGGGPKSARPTASVR
jgi:glycosyltransferase involved in cell wall biosynthesis